MKIKNIIDEDFVNYKTASMFIAFPHCSLKCGKELCQNNSLLKSPDIEIDEWEIVDRYVANKITNAIVIGGLEPFDDYEDLKKLCVALRFKTLDNIVVFTGYDENELVDEIAFLSKLPNMYVKFGRYIPNQNSHFDEVLGINLISDNQYGKKISEE